MIPVFYFWCLKHELYQVFNVPVGSTVAFTALIRLSYILGLHAHAFVDRSRASARHGEASLVLVYVDTCDGRDLES